MASYKTLASREEKQVRFDSGHSLCAGCGMPIAVRTVVNSVEEPIVVANATGCLEVATSRYPTTAWNVPWVHSAFENAAATISGVEAAYQALKRRGKIDKDIKFIAFAGDGGTYDIGIQALSGALERGHDFLYVCLNNEAYMNTGIQRSSATPKGASATTSPKGKVSYGKPQPRKNLTEIVAAHDIPYVAQASISNLIDLSKRVEQAMSYKGATFINILSTCQLGWRVKPSEAIKIAQIGVDTCYWPLYEVREGKYKVNYKPKEVKPVTEWLKPQRRFAHLFTEENKHILDEIQEEVDRNWERLLARSKEK